MEVRALCRRLMTTVFLLLAAQPHLSYSHKDDAAFPRLDPDRLQFFEYEVFVVSCEGLHGLTGWRVMRKVKGVVKTCAPSWDRSTGPCQVTNAISAVDSGEYWCEQGGRLRSNTVNVTVAAGSVILESPVHPVMEGDNMTLRCKQKQTSSNLTATFHKDGFVIKTSSAGQITNHPVSMSDEGLYKCSISDAGESPQSWLSVRAHASAEEPPPPPAQLYLLLCIGVSVVLVALLLLVGLVRCQKCWTAIRGHKEDTSATQYAPASASVHNPSSPQTVSAEASVAESAQPTYALITKPRKVTGPGLSSCSAEEDSFYCTID